MGQGPGHRNFMSCWLRWSDTNLADEFSRDHLFVVTLMSEMFQEFQSPLWLVAVDFKKAFDCLNHSCLWEALKQQAQQFRV